MKIKSIAVAGLGQIGGSLILALKKSNPHLLLSGIDSSKKRRKLMQPYLQRSFAKWNETIEADLIFVCLHFAETIEFLTKANAKQLIVDVCSAKMEIMQIAHLRKLRFIGGHPIAGNEKPLEKGWDENLFRGQNFLLSPAESSSRDDLEYVMKLLRTIKARPLIVNPEEHDRMMAITSHLPALLSRLYFQMSESVPEVYRGPGFHSFTRLAKSSPELLRTFVTSNQRNIRSAGYQFLDAARSLIDSLE